MSNSHEDAELCKAVKEYLQDKFRGFCEDSFARIAGDLHRDQPALAQCASILADGNRTRQAKGDALLSLLERSYNCKLIKGNSTRGVRGNGKGKGDRKGKGRAATLPPALHTLTIVPESLRCFSIQDAAGGPVNGQISVLDIDVVKRRSQGLALTTRAIAIEQIQEKSMTIGAMAFIVDQQRGESVFGSADVMRTHAIASAVIIVKDASDNRSSRPVWIVNFSDKFRYAFSYGEPVVPSVVGSLTELVLRTHVDHSDITWFTAALLEPVKWMNAAAKEILPAEVFAKTQPIVNAFVLKAKKPGGQEPGIIQGFIRVPTDGLQSAFQTSGCGGFIVNAANGKRDQDYSICLVAIPEDFQDSIKGTLMDELHQTFKHELQQYYWGIVPMNREWTRFGVRIPSGQEGYAAAAAILNRLFGDNNWKLPVASKSIVQGVPKSISRSDVERLLQTHIQWHATILHEMKGPKFQGPEHTTYLVGHSEEPSKCIIPVGTGSAITIVPFRGSGKSKDSDWAIALKKSTAKAEQKEDDDEDADLTAGVADSSNTSSVRTKLAGLVVTTNKIDRAKGSGKTSLSLPKNNNLKDKRVSPVPDRKSVGVPYSGSGSATSTPTMLTGLLTPSHGASGSSDLQMRDLQTKHRQLEQRLATLESTVNDTKVQLSEVDRKTGEMHNAFKGQQDTLSRIESLLMSSGRAAKHARTSEGMDDD
eukprot:TRINITY_DN11589_c0_g1_i1.p1 TRINITY_DN11589_c0_g1~~TRINITY_DN11589_c0_g1_i1.p1  ORF type:complete len:704 (+),score=45.89 TRINITY_DN11589_c0_g1_i1:309-2420(+)